jgi:hypothetical protein
MKKTIMPSLYHPLPICYRPWPRPEDAYVWLKWEESDQHHDFLEKIAKAIGKGERQGKRATHQDG